jgi:hypothetical protein
MSVIYDSIPSKPEGRMIWHAVVARDVTAMDELMDVIIPGFDNTLVWVGCRWQPRDATTLPQRGDDALLIFDNNRDKWVPCWWPHG